MSVTLAPGLPHREMIRGAILHDAQGGYFAMWDGRRRSFRTPLEATEWLLPQACEHASRARIMVGFFPERGPICDAFSMCHIETRDVSPSSASDGQELIHELGEDLVVLNSQPPMPHAHPWWSVVHTVDDTPGYPIFIATDASVRRGQPRTGHWAWVTSHGAFDAGHARGTSTSLEMHVMKRVLENVAQWIHLENGRKVIVQTDSASIIPEASSFWKSLAVPHYARNDIIIEHVLGHEGWLLNETAHRLAVGARRGTLEHPESLNYIMAPVREALGMKVRDWRTLQLDPLTNTVALAEKPANRG